MKKLIILIIFSCNIILDGFAQVMCDYKTSIDAITNSNQIAFEKSICTISNIDSLIVEEADRIYSLLGYACMYKRQGIVEFLLNKGANMDSGYCDDIYERDALFVAINSGDTTIVNCLIKNKVNVNVVYDENGLTPLVAACQINDTDLIQMLIDNGANIDGAGDCGGDYILYPLMISIENNNSTIVEQLLALGANTKIQTKQGFTFNDAVSNCKDERIKKIIKNWMNKSHQ